MKSFTRLREGIEFSSTQHEMWTSDNPNPIFKFVGEALVSTSKKNYLVQHFPCGMT